MSLNKIAFIGLGVMGFPMAGHLQRMGHAVTVYNRTRAKAQAWQARFGGDVAATPAAAARDADFVLSCVGNDADLREIALGPDGIFQSLGARAVHVDHSTTSAEVARELASRATAQGAFFLDAPVSGGQVGAENGTLTVMVGGDLQAYARIEPVLGAYARSVRHLGPAGHGQLTKMVNQITIAGVLQGLAEGLAFGTHAGLDMQAVIEVISKGAAQSWQMDNRARSMVEDRFDFGFAVDWMRKDLGIVLEEARRNGSTLPLTALVDQFYAELQRRGHRRLDTSSLIKLLRQS
jgi:3-hydroxyisobutyrate dehydrogenase-like beta-hydroxyacid dehydrogenase